MADLGCVSRNGEDMRVRMRWIGGLIGLLALHSASVTHSGGFRTDCGLGELQSRAMETQWGAHGIFSTGKLLGGVRGLTILPRFGRTVLAEQQGGYDVETLFAKSGFTLLCIPLCTGREGLL